MRTLGLADFVEEVLNFHGSEDETLPQSLMMEKEGNLSIYYAPFDYLNPSAKVVICGITPGLYQAQVALNKASSCLKAGMELGGDEKARKAGRKLLRPCSAPQPLAHVGPHRPESVAGDR